MPRIIALLLLGAAALSASGWLYVHDAVMVLWAPFVLLLRAAAAGALGGWLIGRMQHAFSWLLRRSLIALAIIGLPDQARHRAHRAVVRWRMRVKAELADLEGGHPRLFSAPVLILASLIASSIVFLVALLRFDLCVVWLFGERRILALAHAACRFAFGGLQDYLFRRVLLFSALARSVLWLSRRIPVRWRGERRRLSYKMKRRLVRIRMAYDPLDGTGAHDTGYAKHKRPAE